MGAEHPSPRFCAYRPVPDSDAHEPKVMTSALAGSHGDHEQLAYNGPASALPDNGHMALPVDDDEASQPWLSWTEVKAQCYLAGPLILGNLLSFLLPMICVIFVGHTGQLQLSGASLANSFAVVLGYSWLLGMSSALETLCGQAFGARQYHMVGIYMQRSMVVLNAVSVLLSVLFFFIEPIYAALGQDVQLASTAAAYGVWLIPNLFALSFYFPLVKFLQSQSLVIPVFACFALTLIFHVPICWLLVFKSGMGYRGAALANSISNWITVLLLGLYAKFSKRCADCCAPLSLEALKGLKEFLTLAIPSAMMLCLEWWSYEILVVLSGFLSNPELTTGIVSICVNSEILFYMMPDGMSGAVSTRVSNELGAGHPKAAKGAVNVARILGLTEAILLMIILFSARNVWGKIYSSDAEVVEAVASFIPFFATSSAFDALQGMLSGVLRGAGWQQVGAYMNLGSFYIAGLPTGCLLAFLTSLEGKGLWVGLIVGTGAQFLTYAIFIHFMDWKKEAQRAAERLGHPVSIRQPLLTADPE